MDMDDAIRLNAAGVGIQVFIGGEHETRSVHNMTRLVDAGLRAGIPVMGITAVGKAMVRDAKYFRLACRIIAELGAQYVKTYYVEEDFETVTASCPVPIVMAGGKKLPELDALTMAYNAVQQGASGVDMGRNIFQSEAPQAMIAAVAAVVHKNMKPKEASTCSIRSRRRARCAQRKEHDPEKCDTGFRNRSCSNKSSRTSHRSSADQKPGDGAGRNCAAERGQHLRDPRGRCRLRFHPDAPARRERFAAAERRQSHRSRVAAAGAA